MRWLVVVVLLSGCNAGGLAFDDARVGDDQPAFDGAVIDAPGIDARRIDAELIDAEIHDAEVHDAEIHDAEVYDAEDFDAYVPPDSEIHDAMPTPDAHDPLVDSLTVYQNGFAGSWSVSPTGTPCGPGCNQYAAPTDVTVTLSILTGAHVGWGVGPCQFSGGHSLQCTFHVEGETIQPVEFYCPTYIVDAATGSDSNSGTCGAPFKTITRAASLAHGFQIIRVLAGTYDDTTETFPITIPEGTPIWGDELNHGAAVFVNTTHAGAFVCSTGSELSGVTVSTPNGTAVTANVPCLFRDSVVHDSLTGVAIGGTGARVERVTIRNNGVGAAVSASGADLGNTSQHGGNDLICNGADVTVAPAVTATAVGCVWDHDPPSTADVSLGIGAALDVSSSSLSGAACP